MLCDLRNPRELFACVRRAFPAARSSRRSSFRPLPRVDSIEGHGLPDQQARADRWIAHFASQECGMIVTPAEYIAETKAQQTHGELVRPAFDITCVPSLREVEGLILGLPKHKAAGPDAVCAELLQLTTPVAARTLLPVYMKSSMSLHEPIHFRGGNLICLAKKAGAAFSCDAFRSVLISSIPGKVLHRFWRSRMLPYLACTASPLQAGAFPGVSVEALTSYDQAFMGAKTAAGQVPALLFYDLQAAYYRAIRQVVAPLREGDADLRRMLHSLGLPGQGLQELASKLGQLSELARVGCPDHLLASVSDLFKGTWFRLDSYATLVLTRRGTRPGTQPRMFCLPLRSRRIADATNRPFHRQVSAPTCPLRPRRLSYMASALPVTFCRRAGRMMWSA